MKLPSLQIIVEQLTLLLASFIWTVVILTVISLFWAYQDIQSRWEIIRNAPPPVMAQAPPPPTPTPSITPTPWSPATATPTPPQPPTPTPTWVVPPPGLLPETLNPDDPTPVIVEAEELAETTAPEVSEPVNETATEPATPTELPTQPVDPVATATPVPPATLPPTATATVHPTATPTLGMELALLGGQAQEPPTPAPETAPAPGQTFQPTYLKVPSVSIDAPIIPVGWDIIEQNGRQYSVWQVANNAVGWHQTSAGLGQTGNTVMAGHHNVKGEVFRDLVNVEVGDTITAYAGDQLFEYQVTMKTIVKEKGEPLDVRKRNAEWIAPTNDERLTLVTCWPYTNNSHRVIVIAKRIS